MLINQSTSDFDNPLDIKVYIQVKQDSRNFHIMNMWLIQKTPECLKTKVYEKLSCHFLCPVQVFVCTGYNLLG